MVPGLQAYLDAGSDNDRLVGMKLPASSQWPLVEVLSCCDTQSTLDMHIHAGLDWFIGHFPGQPVLPGVVQTHWAGLFAQVLFTRDSTLQFSRLQKLKFNAVIVPEQRLQLTLLWHCDRQHCVFRYADSDDNAISSGTFCFDRKNNF